MAQEQEDVLDIVRRQNRALRSSNRSLRKKVARLEEHADSIFTVLCDGPEVIFEGGQED